MGTKSIVVEKNFNAPIATVWSALTDVNRMKIWYFDVQDFVPEKGNEFSFFGGAENDKQYLHKCKVVEVVEEKKIAYTWRYDGYEGDSLVSFELFEVGEKTKLILTHGGVENFDRKVSAFDKGNFVAGWNHIVNTGLLNYLEKQ